MARSNSRPARRLSGLICFALLLDFLRCVSLFRHSRIQLLFAGTAKGVLPHIGLAIGSCQVSQELGMLGYSWGCALRGVSLLLVLLWGSIDPFSRESLLWGSKHVVCLFVLSALSSYC